MKLTGKILILLGIASLLFAGYLIWLRNDPNRISFKNSDVLAKGDVKIQPSRLNVISRNIDLPVFEGKIANHQWQITDKGISAIGNVFYGHNWTTLLGRLIYVKPNDIIEITYSDGSIKKYKVTITQEVDPDQKDVLNLADKNTILIYTCSGFLDSKRFIVIASKI